MSFVSAMICAGSPNRRAAFSIPFYTGDCPISIIYGSNARVERAADMVQGTLDSIQDSADYTPDTRSAYVLIGRRR
jgi:hypothetical protein